ncbi:MAG: hypothetical protein K8L99_07995 [Anaerolineae bacterium]|nr:hypothetical protein [Anaerolineae bacterium]
MEEKINLRERYEKWRETGHDITYEQWLEINLEVEINNHNWMMDEWRKAIRAIRDELAQRRFEMQRAAKRSQRNPDSYSYGLACGWSQALGSAVYRLKNFLGDDAPPPVERATLFKHVCEKCGRSEWDFDSLQKDDPEGLRRYTCEECGHINTFMTPDWVAV